MFFLLSTLWFIRETKAVLFYLYLWQLKEYHIGRFLDHFRTTKGKQLLFNKLIFFKLFLLILIPFTFQFFIPRVIFFPGEPSPLPLSDFFPPRSLLDFIILLPPAIIILAVFILYFAESFSALKNYFQKTLKKPVLTKKATFLILINLIIIVLYLFALLRVREIDLIRLYIFPFLLLIFDILTPLIASAIVLIFQPLAVLGRNQIIRKAKKKRAQFKDLLVIGVTGSYGKTSTKEFLATILSEKFNVLKTKEHQNSEVGISQCILEDLKPEHEVFVVEMGAYNRGGIKLLCDIAKPKIGILTGINEQHMATFGSQENIIKAKYELIESLPEDGIAFFNGENRYCLELYEKIKIKKILYGQNVKLAGLENIEGAITVAKELGMTAEEISRACQKVENKLPGIQIKKGINGLNIIDATYSANPDGVIAHLEYLKTLPGKKVIVMPCLIELGKASKEVHQRIGQKIGEVCDLAIITTKERINELRDGAVEKGMRPENLLYNENPEFIFEKVKSTTNTGDVVLLESRVPSELKNLLQGVSP